MKGYMIIFLISTFLLSSCIDGKSEVTMKSLKADNRVFQEKILTLEKENDQLKKKYENLLNEINDLKNTIDKKDSRISILVKEIEILENAQSLINNGYGMNKKKVLELDLNNDGYKDFIKLESSKDKYYRLSINDISITSMGVNVDYNFEIIDINSEDNIKEIAISQAGIKENPKTTIYKYCLDNISYIGKVNGHIDNIIPNGDGSLTTYVSGDILCSWYYTEKYKLSDTHMLVKEDKELHEMNKKVKVLKSIPLLKSMEGREMVAALTIGEEVTLIACDNKKWCQVRKQNGVKGWFEVEDFDKIKGTDYRAPQVFEGLTDDD